MSINQSIHIMKSDIRTLHLNLLRALDALIDERNVTRAAQRLSLTQPAVSGMLTRLRDYFDDPLFVVVQMDFSRRRIRRRHLVLHLLRS
ncbi:probable HTH-type transcriptional regulator LeuO [Salmonella enterica]|nr:probable HTH-type transcriptional regulator LeuO [Salmonella enterica]